MPSPTHHDPIPFLMSLVDAVEQSITNATNISGLKARLATALGVLTWIFTQTINIISDTATTAILEIHNTITAGLTIFVHSNTGSSSAPLIFNRSRGTRTNPLALNTSDRIGTFSFAGFDGTQYTQGFSVRGRTTENWNAGAIGTQLEFVGALMGTTTLVDTIQLQPDAADQETMLLVGVNRAGVISLNRVTLGAVDSGGAGFKLLRVPN